MLNFSLFGLAKCVAAVSVGTAVVWSLTSNNPEESTEVVFHVAEGGVEVRIDEHSIWVPKAWVDPLVYHLSAGPHTVLMCRADHVLYQEELQIKKGRSLVLTLWDKSASKRELAGGYGPTDASSNTMDEHAGSSIALRNTICRRLGELRSHITIRGLNGFRGIPSYLPEDQHLGRLLGEYAGAYFGVFGAGRRCLILSILEIDRIRGDLAGPPIASRHP